jgi:hypothetical protein
MSALNHGIHVKRVNRTYSFDSIETPDSFIQQRKERRQEGRKKGRKGIIDQFSLHHNMQ